MLPRVLHAYLKQVSSLLVFSNSDRCTGRLHLTSTSQVMKITIYIGICIYFYAEASELSLFSKTAANGPRVSQSPNSVCCAHADGAYRL